MADEIRAMNIRIDDPVSGVDALLLEVYLSGTYDIEECRVHVRQVIDVFEALAVSGGLVHRSDRDLFSEQMLAGVLSWRGDGFSYALHRFAYGDSGLALLLRMLRRLVVYGILVDEVVIIGSLSAATIDESICFVALKMESLPVRCQDVPFYLEVQPSGAWVNVRCELIEDVPELVLKLLNSNICIWKNVVRLGGFHVLSEGDGL